MATAYHLSDLPSLKGQELDTTDWLTIDQSRIDEFADVTGDRQWIHVDAKRAASEGPFGGTIAHGYLTLSLLGSLIQDIFTVEGASLGVNYGLDKVRFPAPVPVGSRIRLTAVVTDVSQVRGGVQIHVTATIEVEGSAKPGCVAEALFRYFE